MTEDRDLRGYMGDLCFSPESRCVRTTCGVVVITLPHTVTLPHRSPWATQGTTPQSPVTWLPHHCPSPPSPLPLARMLRPRAITSFRYCPWPRARGRRCRGIRRAESCRLRTRREDAVASLSSHVPGGSRCSTPSQCYRRPAGVAVATVSSVGVGIVGNRCEWSCNSSWCASGGCPSIERRPRLRHVVLCSPLPNY